MSLVESQSHKTEAYKNFINSLDSPISKRNYRYALSYFMQFMKVDDYEKLLQIDVKRLESYIRDYIIYLKQDRKLSSASINQYLAAISHFYHMNDIELKWRKLSKFKGKYRRVVEDRPYTREQIKQLLERAELREKCMILLMCSAGLRRGAIPTLRVKDLEPVDKYHLFKITVYKKEQEQYTTFCTSECRKYIDQYLEWRQRLGEIFDRNTPLFRKQFDVAIQIHRPKPLSNETVTYLIGNLLDKTGIRPKMDGKRTELMQTHGFRKFFETTCITNGMNESYVESIMGHKDRLKNAYFKPTEDQILEGSDKVIGYIGAMPYLTIKPTEEENERLKKQITRMQHESQEWKEIKQMVFEMKNSMDASK